MDKNYEKVNLILGSTIEDAVEILLRYHSRGEFAIVQFNDITLYSDTVTLDGAYIQIIGKTKAEIESRKTR